MAPLFQRLFTADEEVERPKAADGRNEAAAEDALAAESPAAAAVPMDATPAESHDGLIPANKLPSATDALAELFAEPAPTEPPGAPVAPAGKISERASAAATSEPRAMRRGLFARLLRLKSPAASEQTRTTSADPSASDAVRDEVNPVATAQAVAADQAPIPAEALPSAAAKLAAIFPPDEILPPGEMETSRHRSDEAAETEAAEAASADGSEVASEIRSEAPAAVPESASIHWNAEESAPGAAVSLEAPRRGAETKFDGDRPNELQAEGLSGGEEQLAGQLSALEERWSRENSEWEVAPAVHSTATNQKIEESPSEHLLTEAQEELSRREATEPPAPQRLYKDWAFDEKLASHREWVESRGRTGQRADLSNAQLEAMELISVDLRRADLHDANLRASDLLLADLRDACLVRADLEEACVVGANLEGANLEGASLETAMGLVPRQFAGANLRDALLSPELMEFEALGAFQRESKKAYRYFVAMTSASALSWLVIWRTRDVQLVSDSAIIPFLHSHAAAAALPTAESYLIVPAAIFVLYLLFHFHLQRLWDAVMELPAIFPDGHTLGDRGPGILTGLLRTHFRWMNPDPTSTRVVEKGVSLLAAYWIVPATLLLFWARYLTRQEIHGTILQALLAVAATGAAAHATTKVGRPPERWAFEKKWAQLLRKIRAVSAIWVACVVGVVLLLFSAGIIAGAPHERSRAPQYGATDIRRWASSALWAVAYDPYADLTEASISRRPAGWNGADEQIASVDGLRMNNARFRYAQAYGAFLANSHLWRADFQGALLSEADLRDADLGQSTLRFAVMDHAEMGHANLDHANLDGADMRRADLRGANLSYGSLTDAILVDARLDGASFYTARLAGATLTRANLEKADFRESYLGGAHMDHADLRNAYLWSAKLPGADLGGAELEGAILIDADLHGANLGGAKLTATVLNGADLSGTSLEGADLRGALGLSTNQVCSARSRRGATLNPEMETQIEAQCGK